MIENPKKTRRNSRLAIFASLMLSITSAYCTVSGVHSLFIGGGVIVAFIAGCIETSRVSTVFLIHHYWNKLKLGIKSIGCLFIFIACLFSAWGVYGYLSSAYGTQLDNVAPLTLQIQAKQDEIQIQQDIIDSNNKQIEGIRSSSDNQNKLFGKQLESDTSKLSQEELSKMQKQQSKAIGNSEYYQTQINRLYNKNRTANDTIVQLKKEIAQLKEDSIKAAPELQRMKGLASLFGVTDDQILITLVILLIMCIFDPLSMYLMILGDNIGKMADDIEVDAIEKNDDIKKSLLERIIIPFKKFRKEEKKEQSLKEESISVPEDIGDKKETKIDTSNKKEKTTKKTTKKTSKKEEKIQVLSKKTSEKLTKRSLKSKKANEDLKSTMGEYNELVEDDKSTKKTTKIKKSSKKRNKKERNDVPENKEQSEKIISDSIKDNSSTPLNKFNKFIELVKKDKSILNDKKIKDILDANPSLKTEIENSIKTDEKNEKSTKSWLDA